MSTVPRARARPGARRAGTDKKRGRHHHGDLRRALLDAALGVLAHEARALRAHRYGQFSAMELAVPSVEELLGIFNRILIEGARAKE